MEALILACLILIIILLAADKFFIVKKNKPIPEKEQQKSSQYDIMGPARSVRRSQSADNSSNMSHAGTTISEDKADLEDTLGRPDDPTVNVATEDDLDSQPDWEEEESRLLSQDSPDDDGFATGVTFEELVDVNRFLARENLNLQQQKQAAETLLKVQGTEIFNLLQNSISGASQRIADLLDAYVLAGHQPASPNKQSGGAKDFDIGAFV